MNFGCQAEGFQFSHHRQYLFVGCSESLTSSNITDTLTAPGPDSIPVIKSPVTNTSGTLLASTGKR